MTGRGGRQKDTRGPKAFGQFLVEAGADLGMLPGQTGLTTAVADRLGVTIQCVSRYKRTVSLNHLCNLLDLWRMGGGCRMQLVYEAGGRIVVERVGPGGG